MKCMDVSSTPLYVQFLAGPDADHTSGLLCTYICNSNEQQEKSTKAAKGEYGKISSRPQMQIRLTRRGDGVRAKADDADRQTADASTWGGFHEVR